MNRCDVAVIGLGPAGLSAALVVKKVGADRMCAGMDRCPAGFCMPRAMEVSCRELGLPVDQIRKNVSGSELLVGRLGEVRA